MTWRHQRNQMNGQGGNETQGIEVERVQGNDYRQRTPNRCAEVLCVDRIFRETRGAPVEKSGYTNQTQDRM